MVVSKKDVAVILRSKHANLLIYLSILKIFVCVIFFKEFKPFIP